MRRECVELARKSTSAVAVAFGLSLLGLSQSAAGTWTYAPVCRGEVDVDIHVSTPSPVETPHMPQGAFRMRTPGWELLGLTEAHYGLGLTLHFEELVQGPTHCFRLKAVSVKAGHRQPEIWMNPDLERGSCMWNVTWDHELEHVDVFHDYLREFERQSQRRMKAALERIPAVNMTRISRSEASAAIRERVEEIIDDIHDPIFARAQEKNTAMDTPSEYKRLAGKCR